MAETFDNVGYRRAGILSGWVCLLLVLSVVNELAIAGAVFLIQMPLINLIKADIEPTAEQWAFYDQVAQLLGQANYALLAVTGLSFLVWVHRASRNAMALCASPLRYSPASAVVGFFVPILNLFRPPAVLGEIWQVSDPGSRFSDNPDGTGSSTGLVGAWWTCWLVSIALGQVAFKLLTRTMGREYLEVAGWINIGASILSIFAALLAIGMIRGIHDRQELKHRIVSNRPSDEEEESEGEEAVRPMNLRRAG
ncbi:MAG: DUF4328 domain-containing protein [Phycisphaeraceae bacterium]|nr:DUF4328 domain-containing protein [Phycisphaeraceae bacterium]